jgi:RNA 3'-terminal phosphate cyclase
VAEGAANQPLDSLQSDAALKRHLADLVALPMALAGGESQFTTGQVPQRLLSNAWVVNHFLAGRVRVEGEEGGLGNHE